MAKPTYEDATLMLQIAQWMTGEKMNEIFTWILSDDFLQDYASFIKKYPPGSEGYTKVFTACMLAETVGTLCKHGLFNQELLFDWLAVGWMWEMLKGFALGEREKYGMRGLWENFEFLAKAGA